MYIYIYIYNSFANQCIECFEIPALIMRFDLKTIASEVIDFFYIQTLVTCGPNKYIPVKKNTYLSIKDVVKNM